MRKPFLSTSLETRRTFKNAWEFFLDKNLYCAEMLNLKITFLIRMKSFSENPFSDLIWLKSRLWYRIGNCRFFVASRNEKSPKCYIIRYFNCVIIKKQQNETFSLFVKAKSHFWVRSKPLKFMLDAEQKIFNVVQYNKNTSQRYMYSKNSTTWRCFFYDVKTFFAVY